ncbi:MAG: alpha/beta hydrolase [Merismopedia sp. SIO2A8]|nr:alpha/beta hydrolase [Merismopedia sp. SIO2A8]
MSEPYSQIAATLPTQTQAAEERLPLFDDACYSRFYLGDQPSQTVFLFFHGFTAGPYQFVPMAEAMFKQGHNVLIPLLPGHGQAGDWSKENPPPLPTTPEVYFEFVLRWLELAEIMGDRVVVGGLSGGGTLATWLALEKPEAVDSAILFAPYLSSSSKVLDLFVKAVGGYFEWSQVKAPSYPGFDIKALRTILQIGTDVLKKGRKDPSASFFMISSESDRAVGNRDHYALFEDALEYQPHCWYHRFDRVLDIPHTMMTEAEGNQFQDLLITMTQAFVDSDLTWAEVEEVGYRMSKGRTFNEVVAELGLDERVSATMPAMMTMVDKRAIAVKRESSKHRRESDR